MMPEGMPIDLPTLALEGDPFVPAGGQGLVMSRAYHTQVEVLRSMWTQAVLRERWLQLRREARFTIVHITPACVLATLCDGLHTVGIEACFHEDEGLAHLQLRFRPQEPVTTTLLIASGFVDLWEERLYLLADML